MPVAPRLMLSRFYRLLGGCVLGATACGAASAQEGAADTPAPEREVPKIAQLTLPNPIIDEVALLNRARIAGEKNLPMAILPGVIRVQHQDSAFGYAWDPVECRLLFAWRGEDPSELVYVAEGPGPISATIGVWGVPDYFGYRMVNGVPEFLYRLGKVAVEERLEPNADGTSLVQHWKVYQADFGVLLTVPVRCRGFVEPSTGRWSGGFLNLPPKQDRQITLTWNWPREVELPELSKAWRLNRSRNPAKAAPNGDDAGGNSTEEKRQHPPTPESE